MARPFWPPLQGPDLVVDPWSARTLDPATQSNVGYPATLGRNRLVWALPTNLDGPQVVLEPRIVADQEGIALGDPDGNVLGEPGLVIHRLLTANPVQMTR